MKEDENRLHNIQKTPVFTREETAFKTLQSNVSNTSNAQIKDLSQKESYVA